MMDLGAAEGDSIEIQIADDVVCEYPVDDLLIQWAKAGVADKTSAGLTIRIVSSAEMQQSNSQWRGVDKPTNVLSFLAEFPPEAGVSYLGDIMICADVVEQESTAQGKNLNDHWAHIVVHGVLHLQGYDHENNDDAQRMEQQEKKILATLGVVDPYRTTVDSSA